ncbi:hypothetical protein T492DRAFT_865463 [Pavlovales sp. CCMP2436]|nr:hypothetical protein T492DRAFT_865463 [Pavlovales sp. CCMP2436]|mmetsp:Transcript_12436/g.31476  ORF Transcript_12436/g.31476 Transcript_12436/m.31476 type:complete len:144 (+) Transcript_12436:113-544(+)
MVPVLLICTLGLAVSPSSAQRQRAIHAIANRAIHRGAFSQAALLYDHVLLDAIDPGPRSFLLKALLMERMGHWDKARSTFREGNRRYKADGKLLQAWGLMESRTGSGALALRLLRRCVACDSSLAPVLRWRRFASAEAAVVGF